MSGTTLPRADEVTNRHFVSKYSASALVAQAYQEAAAAFQQQLGDNGANSMWIGKSTSINEVCLVAQQVQEKYNDTHTEDSKPVKWIKAFMESVIHYQAVLGILAAADPVHAGLAWGAMRFLLEAVLGYSQLVSQLSKSFARVGQALSRVHVLIASYKTSWMQNAVSQLYVKILSFLYDMVKWYKRWPPWRVIHSTLKPWKISFQGTVDEISLFLDNVDKEAATAGHARLRDLWVMSEQLHAVQGGSYLLLQGLDGKMTRLLQYAEDNETTNNIIQSNTASIPLSLVMDALEPTPLPEEALRSHTMPAALSSQRQTGRDAAIVNFKIRAWESSNGSAILVLQGDLRHVGYALDLAVQTIVTLQKQILPVVWHVCGLASAADITTPLILKSLLFQAVRHDKTILSRVPGLTDAASLRAAPDLGKWLDLSVDTFSALPSCFLVIEVHAMHRMNSAEVDELYATLAALFSRVSGAGAVFKVLVVGFGGSAASIISVSVPSVTHVALAPPPPVSAR